MNELLLFHMDEAFRGLGFKRHQARQKALDSICKEFTKVASRNTIAGLGNWSNNDPGGIVKEHRSGPVIPLEKHLRRHCMVISIDEHCTSILQHVCRTILVGQRSEIRDKDDLVWLNEAYSGQYYKYCHEHNQPGGFCVNRKYNAAWNMPMLHL
ncbi:hypothetical protein H632_c63p1 [Helicosporidium sp. ATCC 50920]|nr:hypothetical protein H632_c63p1 [Helicosporidium sp. ATCC 50920]|eukprot:KDD76929.1 hypothetical protein H632_c63p1 [Helicosporidium sp. ATCC 50920]